MRARLLSKILVITFVSFVLTIPQAFAGERPPAGAKPLVEIIQKLEAEGYSPITEISMDNGVWEVEAYKGNEARELKVNPLTGQIVSDRKDD
ncbi:PepSY domain-containing protein [Microbulbifer thermotolerans]|uniref:PepSY domain-containing protein n=1 Tax=Microbulbifer thermotolerans TaxID=252514 RepID=UPI0008E20DD6|nr:PepSY domain-containing protein [Microbulbifer thermotolerans]MCX2781849.1 PepSY domain-containing protein [Microbulbifer thermotolerans]MCX2795190.1 PepSY domain-containing protein [Microbulbifer thermotolerans]SFC93905.1 Peptidase propeptide and YPEB domain-containing protein [Microbulbifer thermotolerans]